MSSIRLQEVATVRGIRVSDDRSPKPKAAAKPSKKGKQKRTSPNMVLGLIFDPNLTDDLLRF
ncbi:MAG: hypothetical protein KIPDCIKN_00856 [Haliscomenobacter sp.]|nr:hypothetical protein [Haliscomenobacter sp.]